MSRRHRGHWMDFTYHSLHMTHQYIRTLTFGAMLIPAAIVVFSAEPIKSASRADVVCSYAPSQSSAVAGMSGAAGGAAATTAGIGEALGLTVVTHSSGALILSGSSGYIAGTIGTAIAAPVVLSIGALIGGTAITVELLCAPKNHPDGYKNVVDAAQEFHRRTGNWISDAKDGLKNTSTKVATFSGVTISAVKGSAGSLCARVFRK